MHVSYDGPVPPFPKFVTVYTRAVVNVGYDYMFFPSPQ